MSRIRAAMVKQCTTANCSPALLLLVLLALFAALVWHFWGSVKETAIWTLFSLACVGITWIFVAFMREYRRHLAARPRPEPQAAEPAPAPSPAEPKTDKEQMAADADFLAQPDVDLTVTPDGNVVPL